MSEHPGQASLLVCILRMLRYWTWLDNKCIVTNSDLPNVSNTRSISDFGDCSLL